MKKGLFSHGKLLPLLRAFVSYRKLNFKLLRVITWLVMLFAVAGQASAAYSPANVAELLSASKPVSPVKTATSLALNVPVVAVNTSATSVEAKTARPEDTTRPIPEISMEIKSAEYIPPAPKPIIKYVNQIDALGNGNSFPFGQCTWYVASRRAVSWGGDAGTWYARAQATGRSLGATPRGGAIMVSFEGFRTGHVAYVESVNADGSFTVSEMNYAGAWGRVTSRTLRLGETYIVGFIY